MNNPSLQITSISIQNNYIRIDGTITEPKPLNPIKESSKSSEFVKDPIQSRLMTSYYAKKSTSFNIEQEAVIGPKGNEYVNYFVISNHMGEGTIRIPELMISRVTNGLLGPEFTSQTFTEFMTDSTGA